MALRIVLAGLSACVLGLTFGFSQTANAQTRYCWIDAATGKSDPTLPPPGYDRGKTVDENHWSVGGRNFVRVPCPPTEASTTQPTRTGVFPGGGMMPGKDKGDDKRDGDGKAMEGKTPAAPVKDAKPQQADAPKAPQAEKTVTGPKEPTPKSAAGKEISKETKRVDAPKREVPKSDATKTANAPKSTKTAETKSKEKKKEDKTEVHIEFFSTKGDGGGFGTGGFGR